jgi:phosphoglycolate phosphatase
MPRRFDLLVFDWDGTLMDSAACIASALRAACSDLGYGVPSERDARYVIGLGLHDALAHVLPGIASTEYPRVVERYRHHFLLGDAGTTLFTGASEMLRELHDAGHLLAIATGKSRKGLARALAGVALDALFHATRCADEGHSKPHPGMLNWLMDALDVAPDRTLMIGDTTHDMAMARAAGVARLGMTHGAHERAALLEYGPVACLGSCAELRAWLRDHA